MNFGFCIPLWPICFHTSYAISTSSKIRVAIVGSGMAGLSAAWMLNRAGYSVTVFEKGSRPGLAALSRDFSDFVPYCDGPLFGDVPSRMFNKELWPSVIDLYEEANIAFEPVDHQQTFFNGTDVLLKVGLPYAMTALKNALNPSARRLLGSLAAFKESGLNALNDGSTTHLNFGEFIDTHSHLDAPDQFFNGFLFPALTSTVFTCPKTALLNYPCELVLNALSKITQSSSPLMRTVQGSEHAAKSLLKGVDAFQPNTAIEQVSVSQNGAVLHVAGGSIEFDHVVIATQANHASRLVTSSMPNESALLGKFRYVDVPIVVHSDDKVLPRAAKDWSTFNFSPQDNETATCTVWMNRFHRNWPDTSNLFHSIFPGTEIDVAQIHFSATLQRPVVDSNSQKLHQSLTEMQSHERRVWFVGSYASPGVPLLQSAVQSSRSIVDQIGLTNSAV